MKQYDESIGRRLIDFSNAKTALRNAKHVNVIYRFFVFYRRVLLLTAFRR